MIKVLILIDDGFSVVNPESQEKEIIRMLQPTSGVFQTSFLNFDGITTQDKLIQLAIEKGVDEVVCLRLISIQSLAGTFLDLVKLIGSLGALNIRFRSLTERVDTEESIGSFLNHLARSWEISRTQYKSENPKVSQMKAKHQGKYLGRPKKRNDEEILQLRKSGMSVSEIAARTGFSTGTVQKALKAKGVAKTLG